MKLRLLVGSGDRIALLAAPFVLVGVPLNVARPSWFAVGGPPTAKIEWPRGTSTYEPHEAISSTSSDEKWSKNGRRGRKAAASKLARRNRGTPASGSTPGANGRAGRSSGAVQSRSCALSAATLPASIVVTAC